MKIIVTIILSDLVKNSIFVLPYKPKTLYFKAMLNSTNFHKEISLPVIPARIYDTLNFDFLQKGGVEIVSPLHFVYGFARRMFLMLYSIN